MNNLSLTEEKWQAIINNDASYNNQFLYGVKTTGIFCKPSCKSPDPNKENVRIFSNAQEALDENFRPCKRCKPTNEKLPNTEWVAHITDYIDRHFTEKLTLEVLGNVAHGSPFHLQRTFKEVKGMTPVEYIQQVRLKEAKRYLMQTNKPISDIAKHVGIPNTPYFITLFKQKIGYTPAKYRNYYQLKKVEEL